MVRFESLQDFHLCLIKTDLYFLDHCTDNDFGLYSKSHKIRYKTEDLSILKNQNFR